MWLRTNRSICALGSMRRPSCPIACGPKYSERSPRTVTSVCAVWQTLSCACAYATPKPMPSSSGAVMCAMPWAVRSMVTLRCAVLAGGVALQAASRAAAAMAVSVAGVGLGIIGGLLGLRGDYPNQTRALSRMREGLRGASANAVRGYLYYLLMRLQPQTARVLARAHQIDSSRLSQASARFMIGPGRRSRGCLDTS